MTKIYRRPRSLAAAFAWPSASLSAMLMIVAGLSHRFGGLGTYPFLWCLAIAAILAIVSSLLAIKGLVSLWQTGAEGGRRSAWSLLVALFVLAPFADAAFRFMTLPAIAQVSTDIANPPALDPAARSGEPFANRIDPITEQLATEQLENYPEIVGRRYALSPDQVGEIVVQLLTARGWKLGARRGSGATEDPLIVSALAKTPVFAIPADVSVRIIDDGESTIVDMRSAVRFGSHDLGMDRDFVTGFMDDLDVAVAAP